MFLPTCVTRSIVLEIVNHIVWLVVSYINPQDHFGNCNRMMSKVLKSYSALRCVLNDASVLTFDSG